MSPKFAGVFFASVLIIAFASISLAQTMQFKVGSEVEAYTNLTFEGKTGWVKARIIGVDTNGQHSGGPYQVFYDGQNEMYSFWVRTDQVRPRAGQPNPVVDQPAGNNPIAGTTTSQFKVGDRLDVFNTGYTPPIPRGRGTIIEVGDGKYKISYEGCASFHDDWQDRMSVQPEATVSATDPEITFLIGNWAMFSPSYPNTVVRGDNVYREYGTGAKAPPLQIKADGSYVWYFDFGQPPVTGAWSTSATVGERKVRGAANEGISHTLTDTGIIIKDPKGAKWKVYRWIMPGQDQRITAHLMCSGETMVGSRIR